MAATPVILGGIPSGQSPVLKLYPQATAAAPDPAIANGAGDSMTEQTNAKSWYSATVTESLEGIYRAVVEDGSGGVLAVGWVDMRDDTDPVFELDTEVDSVMVRLTDATPTGAVNDASPAAGGFTTTLTGTGVNFYRNMYLVFASGPQKGQPRKVASSDNLGAMTFATAFTGAPADGDPFVLLGYS